MEEKKVLKSIEDLKVGDSVWIRSDLKVGEMYNGLSFEEEMKEFIRERKIEEICADGILIDGMWYINDLMIDWDKTNLLNGLVHADEGITIEGGRNTIEYNPDFIDEPKRKRGFEQISDNQWATDGISTSPENLIMPKRGTKLSAGYDIHSLRDFTLKPNETIKLPTGLKAYMEYFNVLLGVPRSSLGFKYRLQLDNTVAVIDADYYNNEKNEGHIWIKMTNDGNKDLVVKRGDAIAQCIFMRYDICDDDSFDEGNERVGGIGSTNENK